MSRINQKLIPDTIGNNRTINNTNNECTINNEQEPKPTTPKPCFAQFSNFDDFVKNGRRGDFHLAIQGGKYIVTYIDGNDEVQYNYIPKSEFDTLKDFNGSYWG